MSYWKNWKGKDSLPSSYTSSGPQSGSEPSSFPDLRAGRREIGKGTTSEQSVGAEGFSGQPSFPNPSFGSNVGFTDSLASNRQKTNGGSPVIRSSRVPDNKQEVVSITYEEIGLFPRSFSRVSDRFLKQVFSDVENLVVREYRFYRYLFLTTVKCLLILFFVPFFVNLVAKTYVVRPLTEYFWNGKQTEIFLNSYQQKRAFRELKDFEEKLYFESLIYPKTAFSKEKKSFNSEAPYSPVKPENLSLTPNPVAVPTLSWDEGLEGGGTGTVIEKENLEIRPINGTVSLGLPRTDKEGSVFIPSSSTYQRIADSTTYQSIAGSPINQWVSDPLLNSRGRGGQKEELNNFLKVLPPNRTLGGQVGGKEDRAKGLEENLKEKDDWTIASSGTGMNVGLTSSLPDLLSSGNGSLGRGGYGGRNKGKEDEKTESLINAYTLKSSLFVYQTIEADKNIQQRYQEKTIELAQRYNDQSVEAITNFFADLISLLTLFYLLYALEIQINITKSFLLEVFFGLDDSKKSLLILLVTDLLVGYHSSNLWELFFEFLFNHYGLPESQTGIFLLVATLPVLLDVLFKYLIFRHLNRSSPATVATYHAMIE